MGRKVERIGRYFSRIIIKNVGLFLAAGLLTILFSRTEWIPAKELEYLKNILYGIAIPMILSYTAGKQAGGEIGAVAGAMAGAGLIRFEGMGSIMGAVLLGSLAGFVTEWICRELEKRTKAGFEMLTRNVIAAAMGVIFLLLSRYVGLPFLEEISRNVTGVVNWIVERKMTVLAGLFIEPGKVFFLNNGINHGILVPLGLAEATRSGKSMLFLMETNPGPGFGILLACYLTEKTKRREAVSAMAVQFLGGIHEVYFPYVLENLKLLGAVMAGGLAGNTCFMLLDAGAVAPISPGSIFTVLLMAENGDILKILLGIFVSTAVSFMTAVAILRIKRREPILETEPEEKMESEKIRCSRIYFVCDAGMGSSAMGAAMLRRKLKEKEISGIQVKAVPVGEIPEDAEVLVCQKSFRHRLAEFSGEAKVLEVENLTSMAEYERLAEQLEEKNGIYTKITADS